MRTIHSPWAYSWSKSRLSFLGQFLPKIKLRSLTTAKSRFMPFPSPTQESGSAACIWAAFLTNLTKLLKRAKTSFIESALLVHWKQETLKCS